MTSKIVGRHGGLYLAWRLNDTDADSVLATTARLAKGEQQHLYRLFSWVVTDGQAQALMAPAAPLEEITAALWNAVPSEDHGSLKARWIAGSVDRAELARKIESVPVTLGLARLPEEWPFSSAARD